MAEKEIGHDTKQYLMFFDLKTSGMAPSTTNSSMGGLEEVGSAKQTGRDRQDISWRNEGAERELLE